MRLRLLKVLTAPWRLFTWLYENHPKQTVAAIALLVAMSAAGSAINNFAIGQANARNAVTSCENSNEARGASKALWDYVVSLLEVGTPSADQTTFVGEFRDYIDKVYQKHDCDHLDKKYPLPPAPTIPAKAS